MIQLVLGLLFIPFLIDALMRSGIGRCTASDMCVWSALTAFIFCAFLLSKDMPEGITLQYSGAAFLALTLGYSRALLSMALLLAITQPMAGIGQALIADALLPVWLMIMLVQISKKYLPANPFVFLLGCGFIGLFIVYAVQEFAGAFIAALVEGLPLFSILLSENTIWGLLLAGGEATLEGMIITVLVVYMPKAVAMFDDSFYLSYRR